MCLAIPGLVEETYLQDGLLMGKVNFAGIRRATCLEYVPTVEKGAYVLVHVGFAISVIDEDEAQRSYRILQNSADLSELEAALASQPGASDEVS
jgi:hydrogenase expression/formation protein HypC